MVINTFSVIYKQMVGKLKGLGGWDVYGEGNMGFFVLQLCDAWDEVMGAGMVVWS